MDPQKPKPEPGDIEARRTLRAAKRNATLLLFIPLALFAGSFFVQAGLVERLMRAIGEAGAVGGLADWFAVEALFRHPLGLPIPHTALISRRKSMIGAAIAQFVERNFLDLGNLRAEFHRHDRAAQIAAWLRAPATASTIAESLASSMQQAVQNGAHLDAVSVAMPLVRKLGTTFRDDAAVLIGKLTGRLIPGMVDRYLANTLANEIDALTKRLETDGSPDRRALDAWIRVKVQQMPTEWREPILKVAKEVEALEILSSIGSGLPSDDLVESLSTMIVMLGEKIAGSTRLRLSINTALEAMLVNYVAPFGAQISAYIAGVTASWSAEKITHALELQVGKDLQYIRVNGTVVGMVAGLALFGFGELLVILQQSILGSK